MGSLEREDPRVPLTGPLTVPRVDLSKASSWESVRRISDKYLPRWIRTLLDGFEKARAGTSMRALIRLLEGEEFDKVVDEIDWIHIDGPQAEGVRAALPVLIRDVMESTAQEAASVLSRRPQIAVVGAFDVVNPRVTEWVREQAGARITEITEIHRQTIRGIIDRGLAERMSPGQLARSIRDSIGLHSRQVRALENRRARMIADGKSAEQIDRVTEKYRKQLLRRRAEMIARTEIIQAETQGQLELWRQQVEAGILERNTFKEWVVTPDDSNCDACADMDGEKVPLDADFVGAEEGPPLHPNCFSGDAVVAAAGVTSYFKRWFEGEVVVLGASGVADLTVTPNHPILTERGWVAAGLLEIGDRLLKCADPRRALSGLDPDYDYVEARFEDVASARLVTGGMTTRSVPMTAEDFHGDGTVGDQVYVVRAAGNLPSRTAADSHDGLHDAELGIGEALDGERLLTRDGGGGQRLGSLLGSTNGAVRSSKELHPARLRCPRHSNGHALAVASDRKSETLPGPPDGETVATDSPAYINARLAGQVSLVEVTSLVRRHCRAHVYNLETRSGWYFANGILAHNCRCTVRLAMAEELGMVA